MLITILVSALCIALPIDAEPEPVVEPAPLAELLPGLRVAENIVEFDATIAVDAHHPDTPDVYLEMFITAPDSREHESLLLAKLKPSALHAALLAAGFESGAPFSRSEKGEPIKAHGQALQILVATFDNPNEEVFVPLTDWVMHIEDETGIADHERWEGFVFAGSMFTRRGYEADGAGTIASLTTFSNEVIAPVWTISHQAEVDEPVWIVNRDLFPQQGDRVIVRIVPVSVPENAPVDDESSHEPERVDIDRDS